MPSLPPYSNPTHYLQYHCLPHSTGISPTSHVTLAVRSLHCHRLPPSTTTTSSSIHSSPATPNGTAQHDLSSRYGTRYRVLVTLVSTGGTTRASTTTTNSSSSTSSSSSSYHPHTTPDLVLHETPVSTTSSSFLRPSIRPVLSKRSQHILHRPVMNTAYECTWGPPPPTSSSSSSSTQGGVVGGSFVSSSSSPSSSSSSSSSPLVLELPLRYRDISRDAALRFCLLETRGMGVEGDEEEEGGGGGGGRDGTAAVEVARVNLPLWDEKGVLKTGLHRVPFCWDDDGNNSDCIRDNGDCKEKEDGEYYGRDEEEEEKEEYPDEKWDATLILDQLSQIHKSTMVPVPPAPDGGAPVSTTAGTTTSSTTTTAATKNNNSNNNNNQTTKTKAGTSRYPIPESVPWLDTITQDYCRAILTEEHTVPPGGTSGRGDRTLSRKSRQQQQRQRQPQRPNRTSADVYLVIELPSTDFPVVYHETPSSSTPHGGASGSVTALDLALHHHHQQKQQMARRRHIIHHNYHHYPPQSYVLPMPTPPLPPVHPSSIGLSAVQILDPACLADDPAEEKYRALRHESLRGMVDPALKPDVEERMRLKEVICGTGQYLSSEEKDLLWRFRFSLVDDRRALTKFLLAVEWTVESEVIQAAELLEQWRERSPIEVTDALKLLGKNVAFQTGLVRSYAVDTLAAAPDGELVLYLLPLVQALKYETSSDDDNKRGRSNASNGRKKGRRSVSPRKASSANSAGGGSSSSSSSLAVFLVERAVKSVELANYLYWYLKVELDDPVYGPRYRDVFRLFRERASKVIIGRGKETVAAQPPHLRNPFPTTNDSFSSSKPTNTLAAAHRLALSAAAPPPPSLWSVLSAQDRFVSTLMERQCEARMFKGKKDAKETHLRNVLKEGELDKIEGGAFGVPLPSAPDVTVTGVKAESVKLFKSALYPALIEFYVEEKKEEKKKVKKREEEETKETEEEKDHGEDPKAVVATPPSEGNPTSPTAEATPQPSTYKVIVKTGDDLRQDQLVIMLIKLMDRVLKRGTLDLCLKPYPIMATSNTTGLVEFVEGSRPVSQVLNSHNNSILQYFRSVAPCSDARYGVDPEVMQRYIRSCAGYGVITYLLGVGDRHLDNIMLQPSGHFFHIDFGYIFGNDPKISMTGFRLTREMTDGMGGQNSPEYRQFCSLACQAFNLLRKSAGLVLNLLHLMSDAGIEHLSNDQDAVIAKVEERFRLELTDERAETYFLGVIDESLAALAPRVMEFFHRVAVQRR